MKLRNPWIIRPLALAAAVVIRLWTGTLSLRLAGPRRRDHPADPRVRPCIYALWHESILFGVAWKIRADALISRHADGEFIAQAARHLGFGTVRGSSTRGGGAALLQLARRRGRHLVVTPDGPQGPRRRVQPGVALLASLTGLPVVPVGVGCTQAWRATSWDRFLIPRLGARAVFVVGPPVVVPRGLTRAGLESHRRRIELEMLRATADAERRAGAQDGDAPAIAAAA
jgi:lysophospholipid acyltransferase (LPLAT)-like uncharacterized protein